MIKFRILTEKLENPEYYKNLLSDDVKKVLLDKEGNVITTNWDKASNYVDSIDESNNLAKYYLITMYPQWSQRLEDGAIEVIVKLIRELGYNENENPYLIFINNLARRKTQLDTLTKKDWIALNDLYADAYEGINFADIIGKSSDGLNHIIYNPNVYTQFETSTDIIDIVKDYIYLTENESKINRDVIKNIKFNNKDISFKTYLQNNPDIPIRNIIMFKEPRNPGKSEIRDKDLIDQVISYEKNLRRSGIQNRQNLRDTKTNIDNIKNNIENIENAQLQDLQTAISTELKARER